MMCARVSSGDGERALSGVVLWWRGHMEHAVPGACHLKPHAATSTTYTEVHTAPERSTLYFGASDSVQLRPSARRAQCCILLVWRHAHAAVRSWRALGSRDVIHALGMALRLPILPLLQRPRGVLPLLLPPLLLLLLLPLPLPLQRGPKRAPRLGRSLPRDGGEHAAPQRLGRLLLVRLVARLVGAEVAAAARRAAPVRRLRHALRRPAQAQRAVARLAYHIIV